MTLICPQITGQKVVITYKYFLIHGKIYRTRFGELNILTFNGNPLVERLFSLGLYNCHVKLTLNNIYDKDLRIDSYEVIRDHQGGLDQCL